MASAPQLQAEISSDDSMPVSIPIDVSPWRGTAVRPFAPSLERLRLQTYAILFTSDLVVILVSFMLAGAIRSGNFFLATAIQQALLLMPIYAVLALYNRTYSAQSLTRASYGVTRAIWAILLATGLLLFVTFYAKISGDFSRIAFTLGTVLAILFVTVLRIFVVRYVRRNWGPGALNVLVIDDGGPKVSATHAYVLNAQDNMLKIDGDDPSALDRLGRCFENMDRVIVSCPMKNRKHWAFFLRAAGVDGEVVTEVGHDLGAIGLRQHGDFTSMIVAARPLSLRNRLVKRIIDIALSGLALLFLSPLFILTAALVKLHDGGPVLFVQRRIGRGNRFFGMYKFRSMTVANADADGNVSATRDDDRITPIGRLIRRTSIDELPQLLNVLKGDMS